MKGNVLIIEDERELGELIQLFLSNEGITSALAGTAEEGISRIAREDYDLVILDLNLPGMDGFEFLQQFRRNQTIPVIIVSAKTADEDIISGLGIGADEFATKPFKPRVLTARVRALLRRSSHYSDGKRKIFNFGEFELDYDGFLLKKGGRAVGLSTREMEVLRFLIINAGNIYTPPGDLHRRLGAGVWRVHHRGGLHSETSEETGAGLPPACLSENNPRQGLPLREGVTLMNLRHQFIILILTVVLMPVFMMGISFSLFNKVMYSSDPRIISEEFFTRARDAESTAQVDELFDTLEDSYVGIMVEASDIFFSDPETDYNRLDPVMIVASRQQTFSDGSSVYIILGVKIFEKSTTVFTVIFILSIMLPLILIPLMIIRSINSSINKLEAATGRIADGELDFELKMKRRDKLGSLAVSLDTMRRQIKSEQDRRNRFYMGVSHDLMTPLAHIGGYSDALLEGLSQNEEMTHKYLKIINNKSHQMEQRITQLLDYLNCSNADFRQDLEENSIGEFLTEYLQLHQEEQGFYNRTLNWEVNISQNCLTPFHEELVTRALDNLIQNGFKYGTEGSSMEVEAREEDARIIIDVVNHGAAIPRESLETIFEPFFRGDKTRRGDGFGLGLSSVKSIAESHGWFITVKSDEEETRFSILIPKAVKK